VRCPSEKGCAEQRKKEKDSVYSIRDGENKIKKPGAQTKKGPAMGLEPYGTRTHVGMSKGLDLHSKEQESTSHQAALVVGGINLINTRTWATCNEATRRNTEIRENAQRHGCNSESERRSRRVADINNGQNKEQAKGGSRERAERERTQGRGKGNIGGGCPRTNHMGGAEIGTPRADMAQTAGDSRVAHRKCAADINK
jgi:hypothetical protein